MSLVPVSEFWFPKNMLPLQYWWLKHICIRYLWHNQMQRSTTTGTAKNPSTVIAAPVNWLHYEQESSSTQTGYYKSRAMWPHQSSVSIDLYVLRQKAHLNASHTVISHRPKAVKIVITTVCSVSPCLSGRFTVLDAFLVSKKIQTTFHAAWKTKTVYLLLMRFVTYTWAVSLERRFAPVVVLSLWFAYLHSISFHI